MTESPIQILDTESLERLAQDLRLDILDMTTKAGSGHPSSSWSAVEILTALYFGGILNYRPDEPWWRERDRFIMSKGHAAPLRCVGRGYVPFRPVRGDVPELFHQMRLRARGNR